MSLFVKGGRNPRGSRMPLRCCMVSFISQGSTGNCLFSLPSAELQPLHACKPVAWIQSVGGEVWPRSSVHYNPPHCPQGGMEVYWLARRRRSGGLAPLFLSWYNPWFVCCTLCGGMFYVVLIGFWPPEFTCDADEGITYAHLKAKCTNLRGQGGYWFSLYCYSRGSWFGCHWRRSFSDMALWWWYLLKFQNCHVQIKTLSHHLFFQSLLIYLSRLIKNQFIVVRQCILYPLLASPPKFIVSRYETWGELFLYIKSCANLFLMHCSRKRLSFKVKEVLIFSWQWNNVTRCNNPHCSC